MCLAHCIRSVPNAFSNFVARLTWLQGGIKQNTWSYIVGGLVRGCDSPGQLHSSLSSPSSPGLSPICKGMFVTVLESFPLRKLLIITASHEMQSSSCCPRYLAFLMETPAAAWREWPVNWHCVNFFNVSYQPVDLFWFILIEQHWCAHNQHIRHVKLSLDSTQYHSN